MSRVPWHLFQKRQPRVHLVVGAVVQPDGPVGGDELMAAQSVLRRLVRKQEPAGDYGTTIVRETGRPELYLAFEAEDDARNLASLVAAEPTGSYPGWASQQAFLLEGAKLSALAASLPAPKAHRNEPPPDGPSLSRRVRRGPRTPNSRPD
jgi:hypothetical protein